MLAIFGHDPRFGSLLGFFEDRVEFLRLSVDGSIEENWFRKKLTPLRSRRIDGGQIPEKAFVLAAFRVERAATFRLLECHGDQVIGVPELADPAIAESPEHACTRAKPIRRQNRFPYREHHDPILQIAL